MTINRHSKKLWQDLIKLVLNAILSFLGVILHGFIGGKMYGTNINKSDLEPLKNLMFFQFQFFYFNFLV